MTILYFHYYKKPYCLRSFAFLRIRMLCFFDVFKGQSSPKHHEFIYHTCKLFYAHIFMAFWGVRCMSSDTNSSLVVFLLSLSNTKLPNSREIYICILSITSNIRSFQNYYSFIKICYYYYYYYYYFKLFEQTCCFSIEYFQNSSWCKSPLFTNPHCMWRT